MNSSNIGEVVSFPIPQGKENEFWKIIEDAGFEKTGKGVLEFVLAEPEDDFFEGEEENEDGCDVSKTPLQDAMLNWAKEHPEDWDNIKKKGAEKFSTLLSFVSKKMK